MRSGRGGVRTGRDAWGEVSGEGWGGVRTGRGGVRTGRGGVR